MLLKCFSATLGVSWLQLASVIPMATLMWLVGFVRVPSLTRDDVKKLVPVGAAFAVGHLLTVASFGSVAISFTHVVKAAARGRELVGEGASIVAGCTFG